MLLPKLFFLLGFLSFFNPLISQERIVIIGAGPAGLAAAIVAKDAGADVIIVEKREHYLRERFVFLLSNSLDILDQWDISIPELVVWDDSEAKIGLTKINILETSLSHRVEELGIPRILGEFQAIRDGNVVITEANQIKEIPYDLLVGADGMHSRVRDHLNISLEVHDNALGSFTIIPFTKENYELEYILPFKFESVFINRIVLPSAILFNAQAKGLSREMLLSAVEQLGWTEDVQLLSSKSAIYLGDIEISLQQSLAFSNSEKSAILLGDAAATASFLQGKGANYALETAVIAGQFFKTRNYSAFNESMREATVRLISDSTFLFE